MVFYGFGLRNQLDGGGGISTIFGGANPGRTQDWIFETVYRNLKQALRLGDPEGGEGLLGLRHQR